MARPTGNGSKSPKPINDEPVKNPPPMKPISPPPPKGPK